MMEALLLDFVTFTDDCSSQTKSGTLEDTFSFVEDVFPHRFYEALSDTVVWNDRIDQVGIRAFYLTDTLTLSEDISNGPRASFEDTFFFIDYFPRPNPATDLDDELAFIDTMTATGGPSISEALTFVEDLDYTIITIRVATDTVTLRDGFGAYLNDPWAPIFPIVEPQIP